MKRNFFCFTTFILLSLALYSSIFADTVATPCSYVVSSDDERYIFVMLSVKTENECLSQGTEEQKKIKELHKKYKFSGLYEKNNSAKPLWTVDWYSYQVFISSDGKYLVRTGSWASKETDEAFSFFDEGKLIKTYQINEIVRYVSALPHSVSHFQWEKELKLNASTNSFEVTTLEDGKFSFDIKNGEIISQNKPITPNLEGLTEPRLYSSIWRLPIVIIVLLLSLFFVLYRILIVSKE